MVIFDDDLSSKQVQNIERGWTSENTLTAPVSFSIFLPNGHRLPMPNVRVERHNTSLCRPDSPGCGLTSNDNEEVSACVDPGETQIETDRRIIL